MTILATCILISGVALAIGIYKAAQLICDAIVYFADRLKEGE